MSSIGSEGCFFWLDSFLLLSLFGSVLSSSGDGGGGLVVADMDGVVENLHRFRGGDLNELRLDGGACKKVLEELVVR